MKYKHNTATSMIMSRNLDMYSKVSTQRGGSGNPSMINMINTWDLCTVLSNCVIIMYHLAEEMTTYKS